MSHQVSNSNDSYVLVVDSNGQPLMPCLSKRAYYLRKNKRARIYCMNPFTIQILDRTVEESVLQDTEIKLDPGSKTTGMAFCVKGAKRGWFAVQAVHIEHRSNQIRDGLTSRRQIRRSRRQRKTRYRAPRFKNRARTPRVAQDSVVLHQPSGKYKGKHTGIIAIRANGRFDIITEVKQKITASWKNIQVITQFNGYHITHKRVIYG